MAYQLRTLTESEKEYARSLFPPEALYFSRRGNHCEFRCMCCGHISHELGKWPIDDNINDTWTCPECGAECKVLPQYSGGFGRNYDRKTGRYSVAPTSSIYVTLVDAHAGYQVFRTFDVMRNNHHYVNNDGIVAGYPTDFSYYEVYQIWIDEKGKETIISNLCKRGFNFFHWEYSAPFGIGHHNSRANGCYSFEDVYDMAGNWFFPKMRIAPILRRNGLNARVIKTCNKSVCVGSLSIKLLRENLYEELVKTGQLALVCHFMNRRDIGKPEDFIREIRVCTRHGYIIKDAGMWFDYVYDLNYLGLDTLNPHYICPKDLRAAHNQTQKRVERIKKKKQIEEDIQRAKRDEADYAKKKGVFFGIAFGDDTVTISVLKSVEDVRQEGAAMHHCVFANGYYRYDNNLLLSARDSDGNRLETIEIDLDRLSVAQCRGLQNQFTPEHEHILALCNEHMREIKRAKMKRKITA